MSGAGRTPVKRLMAGLSSGGGMRNVALNLGITFEPEENASR